MWHRPQPILTNWLAPWTDVLVGAAGVGAADRRMKAAKLTTSEEKSDAGLAVGSDTARFVESSGVAFNRHPGVSSRSLGNASLVTPCSTL
jgi:hypothetical protein